MPAIISNKRNLQVRFVYSLVQLLAKSQLTAYIWSISSIVARLILVMGSKSNLVHRGRAPVQQNYSCLDEAIIAEVQSVGSLCWATQCILLTVLGEMF